MNHITIELSAEDRARLDKIIGLLGSTSLRQAQEAEKSTDVARKEPEAINIPTGEETPVKSAEKAVEEAPAPAPAPDRRTVKSIAVKKIQAGNRDAVKALIQSYGAEKIDMIAEHKLAAFVADLEKIGG